jgi:hypothetical protein
MKKLYILAPNDRFNYGDLLFPHILRFYLKDIVDEMVFCSTTESDLLKLGGIPTCSFQALYKAKATDQNYLIVAGGDSLCISWMQVLSFVDRKIDWLTAIDHKLHTHFFFKAYTRLKYGYKTLFPFSIGKNELGNFSKVMYNSLGGSMLEYHGSLLDTPKVIEVLRNVDYLSLRDIQTSEMLNSKDISNVVVPDSAILMSDVFTEELLVKNLSVDRNRFQNKKYLFFQTNLNFLDLNAYVAIIEKVIDEYQLNVCLCPIGTALGHSDDIALAKIYSQLKCKDKVLLINSPNIYDIMWLIKHTALYVGTSLHGTITALSFEVPFVAHGPIKLKNYLDTWCKGKRSLFTEEKDLESAVDSQIEHHVVYISQSQKQQVMESINHMKDEIKE